MQFLCALSAEGMELRQTWQHQARPTSASERPGKFDKHLLVDRESAVAAKGGQWILVAPLVITGARIRNDAPGRFDEARS